MIKSQIRFLAFSFLVLGICLPALEANAATYSSKAIIENARLLDGKKVTYRGEAITAIMKRGEDAWINVSDGNNAISIWCRHSMLEGVKFLGDYKFKGDIIEVEGSLNRACSMHGGELDIHAKKLRVVKSGYSVKERTNPGKMVPAGILFVLTLAVTVVFRKRI